MMLFHRPYNNVIYFFLNQYRSISYRWIHGGPLSIPEAAPSGNRRWSRAGRSPATSPCENPLGDFHGVFKNHRKMMILWDLI